MHALIEGHKVNEMKHRLTISGVNNDILIGARNINKM